ncbi:hypothetical protein C8Q69DRAFT_68224 [Paecilomyces variotii]|uniref:Uncharacterized protein n=1 Tax=Byssochlamys spectabilis TaxID=264951 RepID=A0A443HNK1_BYSSP|nr:hypothetical protein C8Q69DRAFT_68224 [Paecilomyces variotii]KAJ9270868.1 hypothetical protein DTO212C5_3093 [Paecilomyces variotii]KAJ9306875.1 hypothetical protein DTO217A2_3656 [Paecilomyces variotii]KAJ9324322.1 hypothetical protein DTO027B3_4608 [Paecilomyces variotii]KAJ9334050.1 hypothetical protein DTO027B5_4173 [Paecilomyces variotii]KAJ9352521.1 hypothetical protein DTO027B9_5760 [Paecilomyces variotii]
MIATPMSPQTSHVRHTGSDSSRTSSHLTSSFPSPATLSQEPPTTHNMLSTLPTTAPNGHGVGMSKRPKLSLQTTSLPVTYGKSTTGLSLSLATANATASPTVLNTFNNAYELMRSSTSTVGDVSPSKGKIASPYATNRHKESVPYQLPLGVRSILRNSPIPASSRRQRSVSMTGNNMNGSHSNRRLLFPASKQVSYRFPLEEEVKTVRFTARHSDMLDDSEPEISDESQSDDNSNSQMSRSDSSSSDEEASKCQGISPLTHSKRKRRKSAGVEGGKLQLSRLDGHASRLESPQTPCQEHPKRRREWRWTLGPLPPNNLATAVDTAAGLTDSTDESTASSSTTPLKIDMPYSIPTTDLNTTLSHISADA